MHAEWQLQSAPCVGVAVQAHAAVRNARGVKRLHSGACPASRCKSAAIQHMHSSHRRCAPLRAHVGAVVVGGREGTHQRLGSTLCACAIRRLSPERVQESDRRRVRYHVRQKRLAGCASGFSATHPGKHAHARTCRSHAGLRGSRACSGVSRLPTTASQDSTTARVRSVMKVLHESRIHMQSPTSPSRNVGAALDAPPLGGAAARESAVMAAACCAKCDATCEQGCCVVSTTKTHASRGHRSAAQTLILPRACALLAKPGRPGRVCQVRERNKVAGASATPPAGRRRWRWPTSWGSPRPAKPPGAQAAPRGPRPPCALASARAAQQRAPPTPARSAQAPGTRRQAR